jgi:hypothetical protein
MSTVNNGPQIVRSGLVLDLDASYMRSYSPNVHPNPTNIFAWSGTGNNNCTLSGDSSITRQYGSIPLKMVMTGTDPYTGTYNVSTWNLAPAANGQTWTLSFYAKGSETLTGNCFIFGANSSGNYIEAPSTSFTVTSSWQRFTFTATFSNASTAYIQIRFGASSGQVGKTIWWDGVQVERASAATILNPYYFGNTSWRDVSGSNYNGSLNTGPLFSSANGGSIAFDGTTVGQEVNIGTKTINFASGGTFEIWTKIDNVNRNQGFFSMSPGTSYINFYSPGATNQKMRWEVIGNVGVSYNSINSITSLQNNIWYHVVGNFDPSGGSTRIYINGSLDNSQSSYTNVPSSVTSQIIIGEYAGVLDGNIAVAKIYNRVLSASEVAQNYQAMKTKFGL